MNRGDGTRNADEGFLARWSRRKRQSDDTREIEDAADEISGEPPESASQPMAARDSDHGTNGPADATNPEGLTEEIEDEEARANRVAAEAIDLESLTSQSDITAFLKRGVPKALKNAALSRMWRSNPVFAVLDGLNDYDDDYRNAQTFADGFKSAWAVGKGYADKADEIARRMEEESARLARLRAGVNAEPEEVPGVPGLSGSAAVKASRENALAAAAEDDTAEASASVSGGEGDRTLPADAASVQASRNLAEPSADPDEQEQEERMPRVGLRRRMQFGQDPA
ncbi:DUF3306 domain-containing protein [Roseibium aestuarii]|uniref:DUF3306 domain-containing protein n=1 Tax=Roseibium aestuarii TaxID=2600299 RepID=A0ABW4JS72_9HYPH|nr:DUF3306 domain-containing protein [Roseibium aestuarii]